MNTRIELSALSAKYRNLCDEATFRHVSYRNSLRYNYYKDLGIQEKLYLKARNVLISELKRLYDTIPEGCNDHLQKELELLKERRKMLASDFEAIRTELKLKLKDSLAKSLLDERKEITDIQQDHLKQHIAILSNAQKEGGQDE